MEEFMAYIPLDMLSSSSSLSWPPQVVNILREIEGGNVESGHDLYLAIVELRKALSLSWIDNPCFSRGFIDFFDKIMSKEESRKWFKEAIPALANLLLRFPSLLETHYQNADVDIYGDGAIVTTALRILDSQQPGVVFLSQELIAALLCCSLFCLFPEQGRDAKHLPMVNFDRLFVVLDGFYFSSWSDRIWCIIHYFQRISSDMPKGMVSFERKVLPYKNDSFHISYPDANFWSTSDIPLCKFEVHSSGLIEDQSDEAIEVYFVHENFGSRVLSDDGGLPEEIRFVLCPELIASMLFLPAMKDNEAIEIVGVERFSTYAGYSSSFRFSGVYVDQRDVDTLGRRKTRIVQVDTLRGLSMRPYTENCFLCEVNKAFCGFLDQRKYRPYHTKILQENHGMDQGNNIGVATGDAWESDFLGRDPETKAMVQWLAASQAQRPFIRYCTFGEEELEKLGEVANLIYSRRWTVGQLWNVLTVYLINGSKGKTNVGFFQWLLQKHMDFIDALTNVGFFQWLQKHMDVIDK